jgi:hypothetical protein
VRFDCSGPLAPKGGAGCATRPDVPQAATNLVAAASQLLVYQADHTPPEARWTTLRTAIDDAAKLGALPDAARIVLQNAALRIAIYAARGTQRDLARAAFALADKLALEPKRFASSDPVAAEYLLGPIATWRHRDRRNAPLMHASLNMDMMYFRPVLAGTTRAVIGQLIAFDTAGAAHLTPIISDLEMRASAEPTSAACVMELDLVDLLCAPPGIRVVDPTTHPTTHFFRRTTSGELECNGCHDANTFPIVAETDAPALIASEIERALAAAKSAVAAARR